MTPPLVMPTIEPDWDASLAGAVAYTDARTRVLPVLPCFL
jgi:hypothetical protein